MAVLEVETFTLDPDIDASQFKILDEQMQEWCYLNRPGLARRTTAMNDDGSCIIITLFADITDATPVDPENSDPVVDAWRRMIPAHGRMVKVYALL